MKPSFQSTSIEGVFLISLPTHVDNRGIFFEVYKTSAYIPQIKNIIFKQDNISISKKNVLRGLHYQINHPQAQLVTVVSGAIFDVTVDLREGSPTFGTACSFDLSDTENQQIFMAPGIAHGFFVKSDTATLNYKVTEEFNPNDEAGVSWRDPDLAINWPTQDPIINERDARFPALNKIFSKNLPKNC